MDIFQTKPLVSIIIPTYNRADLLLSLSVKSVIEQSYDNWELLIIDDGSTDATAMLCGKLVNSDKRIKYFYQENRGQGAARNLGIKNSLGSYVLFLDSDDYLLFDMLQLMMKEMLNKKYNQISCKSWVFDYNKNHFNSSSFNISCVIFKKTLFEEFGFFDESNNLRGVEDADLYINWEIKEKLKNTTITSKAISDPLVVYLKHKNQETSHFDLKKLDKKINAIIDKYKNNKNMSKSALSLRYMETGNFNLLIDNKKIGKDSLKKSLKIYFSWKVLLLLFISFLGTRVYKISVNILKAIREKIIWKIKLKKIVKKYPDLYSQAQKIVSSYKNW